jgi:hypothetical protein
VHKTDVSTVSAALSALALLREVAVSSAPGGSTAGGKSIEFAWSQVLAGNIVEDELRTAAATISEALHTTKIGNQRLSYGVENPNEVNLASRGVLKAPPVPDAQDHASLPNFSGDGTFLTPRMRKVAEKSRDQAVALASDTLNVAWFDGEPGKLKAIQKKREEILKREEAAREMAMAAEALAEGMKEQGDGEGQANKGKGKKGKRKPESPKSDCSSSQSSADGEKGKGKGKAKKGKGKGKVNDVPEEKEEKLSKHEREELQRMSEKDWIRALGYDTHDQKDFDRVWRNPLMDLLNRTFSHASEEAMSKTAAGGFPFDAAAMGTDTQNDANQLANAAGEPNTMNLLASASAPNLGLTLEMVHSAPGQLKLRCTLPSQDRVTRLVSERRVKDLLNSKTAAATFTQQLGKTFRKNGYLIPKYGINVNVRKDDPVIRKSRVAGSMSATTLEDGQTKLPVIAAATR